MGGISITGTIQQASRDRTDRWVRALCPHCAAPMGLVDGRPPFDRRCAVCRRAWLLAVDGSGASWDDADGLPFDLALPESRRRPGERDEALHARLCDEIGIVHGGPSPDDRAFVAGLSDNELRNLAEAKVPALNPGTTVLYNDHGHIRIDGKGFHFLSGRTPRAIAFRVRELAQALFATDPRVVALVNRVTDTKGPTWQVAREERRDHPWVCREFPPRDAEPSPKAGAQFKNASAAQAREARACAFQIAWGRERAIRHECLRRAVAIFRGLGGER